LTAYVMEKNREFQIWRTSFGLCTTVSEPAYYDHCLRTSNPNAMLKYFDFGLQTIAIVTPFATDFLGLHTAVFMALLLGPLQLVSSSISVLKEAPLLKYKSMHLALSAGFFIFYFAGTALEIIVKDSVYHLIFPLILAAYYYGLTMRWAFFTESRSRNSIKHTRLTS
jgi:hypothetical protein